MFGGYRAKWRARGKVGPPGKPAVLVVGLEAAIAKVGGVASAST
jgi:hypothetical protein